MKTKEDRFKHVCWLYTQHTINRYLMSNADGRQDGAEKAERHMQLCRFYVAIALEIEEERVRRCTCSNDLFVRVHDDTTELTAYLDEQIGFPLKGDVDYDRLAPLFFEKFHRIALTSLHINQGEL